MKTFGDRLLEARESRGLTQRELAIQCDTDEAVIKGYEKNRRFPGKSMLLRLCVTLRCPPDFLLQDELDGFNPYEEKGRVFSDIDMLSPDNFILLVDFVDSLKKRQNNK